MRAGFADSGLFQSDLSCKGPFDLAPISVCRGRCYGPRDATLWVKKPIARATMAATPPTTTALGNAVQGTIDAVKPPAVIPPKQTNSVRV